MSEQAPRTLLEVHELRAGYGYVPVLHGVSLRVAEGQALGIEARCFGGRVILTGTGRAAGPFGNATTAFLVNAHSVLPCP